VSRVPRMTGLPTITFGFMIILSSRSSLFTKMLLDALLI
jgi:hypothetical protein